MAAPKESLRKLPEAPWMPEQLSRHPASVTQLQQAWVNAWSAGSGAPDSLRVKGTSGASSNTWLYDPQVGLGLLARTILLRDVFLSMIYRDGLKFQYEPWKMCLRGPSVSKEVFDIDALTGSIGLGAEPGMVIRDPEWQRKLCDGLFSEGIDEDRKDRLKGLNRWFGGRYNSRLVGGRMTPELLFASKFFGRNAPERFLRYVLTGDYEPGSNASLLLNRQTSIPSEWQEQVGRLVSRILRKDLDNEGKPIISIACPGRASLMSGVAAQLHEALESAGRNTFYVPLTKQLTDQSVDDAGFRAIVDVIYQFTRGQPRLEERDSAEAPTESADEQVDAIRAHMRGKPATKTLSVDEQVDAIRTHLISVPTVLILDGFSAPLGPFPAIAEFMRDEPLGRLLRRLQHPFMGSSDFPQGLSAFRGSYFVVLGEQHPAWLSMHRLERVDLDPEHTTVEHVLEAIELSDSLASRVRTEALKLAPSAPEWKVRLLAFLVEAADHVRQGASSRDQGSGRNTTTGLDERLRRYWLGLASWQRIFLGALSLSETGLRRSTVLQLFDSYSRMQSRSPGVEEIRTPPPADFEEFLLDLSGGSSSPLLVVHPYAHDQQETEAFDHPSEVITALTDVHPWALASSEGRGKRECIDFISSLLRQVFAALLRPEEVRALRRAMCELSLQAYRIRVRRLTSPRQLDVRAQRSLVEAIFHGLLAIDLHKDRKRVSRRDDYTVGEVPGRPADALAFLYFTVFRELLCGGKLANIGRHTGNCDLELELLLFFCRPSDPFCGLPAAIDHPEHFLFIPVDLDNGRVSRVAAQHLLALAHCARRSSRMAVLEGALRLLSWRRSEGVDWLTPAEQLSVSKLRIDFLVRSSSVDGADVVAMRALQSTAIRSIVRSAIADNVERVAGLREIRIALRTMRRGVRTYIERSLNEGLPLSPQSLDDFVTSAFKSVSSIPSLLKRVPADGISVLSRLAVLSAQAAHAKARRDKLHEAMGLYIAAMATFWLCKLLAGARTRENPIGVEPSRVSAQTASETVKIAGKVKEILGRLDRGHDDRWLVDRLIRGARATLDTYTREQASNLGDRITMNLLESTFARLTAPDNALQNTKNLRTQVTGDYRLHVLLRCLRWLRDTEQQMLPISGRPSIRLEFAEERLSVIIDMLDRLHGDDTTRRVQAANRHVAPALFDWMRNDLLQLAAFVEYMAEYAPKATKDRSSWATVLSGKVEVARARLRRWEQADDSAQLRHSRKLLAATLEHLTRSPVGEASREARPVGETVQPA